MVERDKVGGTCLHRGCIPTKVLLQTADVLAEARAAGEFGVRLPAPELDYAQVRERKTRVVDQLYRGLQSLVRLSKVETIAGTARFEGPGSLLVQGPDGEQRVSARNVIVATGSRPRALPGLTADGRYVFDSDQILEAERVPRSIVILGSGAVGVEFASCYADYGAAVTLVEMLPAIVPLEDRDVANALGRSFSNRGIQVVTGHRALAETFEQTEGGIRIQLEGSDGARRVVEAEALLVAVGRAPVTDNLQLDRARVKAERGYIPVDETMRTNVPGVYAVGDVNGQLLLAHVAAAQGTHAADVIANAPTVPVNYGRLPRTTYCRPQIGSIGMSEDEAKQVGRNVKIGRAHLRVNGKALIAGETEGFVKVVADADRGDVLGVHILGHGASELIAEIALGQLLDAAVWEIARTVYPHPTVSEALGEAAQAALRGPVKL
jgi:dihydrolipoamide dehydrogenase